MFNKTPAATPALLVMLAYAKDDIMTDKIKNLPWLERRWVRSKALADQEGRIIPVNIATVAADIGAGKDIHRMKLMMEIIARAAVMHINRAPTAEDKKEKEAISKAFHSLAEKYISQWARPSTQASIDKTLYDTYRAIAAGKGKVALETTNSTAALAFT